MDKVTTKRIFVTGGGTGGAALRAPAQRGAPGRERGDPRTGPRDRIQGQQPLPLDPDGPNRRPASSEEDRGRAPERIPDAEGQQGHSADGGREPVRRALTPRRDR